MKPQFTYSANPVLVPQASSNWADTMILNPAIIKDPCSETLHMLFRATGPYTHKKLFGSKYDPYPIFLGYAVSEDRGETWSGDFSKPALAPLLNYEAEKIWRKDIFGKTVIDYANGCIEDPRIFEIEGSLFVSVACRMFPPGPYWIEENLIDPFTSHTNIPKWANKPDNPFGLVAYKNETVSVLFKLSLDKLKNKEYDEAFTYVCNLTDGNVSDNRDVMLFPEKMMIGGKMQYVMIHRPLNPAAFGSSAVKPSIILSSAENLGDFSLGRAVHKTLAVPTFEWETEKIGASWQPLSLQNGQWLLSYHGVQLPDMGYTQSFMILEETENDFPKIKHRCSERLMYASQDWELPDKFFIPCLFSTGGAVIDNTLIISYGAADEKSGIAMVNIDDLISYIRRFDANGNFA